MFGSYFVCVMPCWEVFKVPPLGFVVSCLVDIIKEIVHPRETEKVTPDTGHGCSFELTKDLF